ncbi:MAG TPA: glutamate synthase (NADPH), homotetrameric [Acholeplasmataceae bacterium]|nr:glutamate synthase (NADPH), homotetrameric [Acholeplasmataceae bacterium]
MLNTSQVKNKMPVQDPIRRISNFNEVALGYTDEQALDEARRCLDCKHKPCVNGCPVGIDIPAFIQKIIDNQIEEAYQIILESSMLSSVCGRVCPQETQCELLCVRANKGEAVAIGNLERYVSDYHFKNIQFDSSKPILNGFKVAVVGSGPAGLSCANDLNKLGYQVDIYEALHEAGGVLTYGIPEFRLPKAIVKREIEQLIAHGVNLITNVIIGKSLSIDDLFDMGYQAIFLGTGAGLPKFLGVPGEMLNGVYSANEYLTRINLMKSYEKQSQTPIQHPKRVAVIGGGNVALDAARSAKRLGVEEVYIVYRRSLKELPARYEEVEHAVDEGIQFKLLANLKEIIGNSEGFVKEIRCVDMILGAPDQSGRAKPIENPQSSFFLEVDQVIMAIGTTPNPLVTQSTEDLETNEKGCIITQDAWGLTTKNMVYAGGDVVTGSATVILAMGADRQEAQAMHQKITLEKIK